MKGENNERKKKTPKSKQKVGWLCRNPQQPNLRLSSAGHATFSTQWNKTARCLRIWRNVLSEFFKIRLIWHSVNHSRCCFRWNSFRWRVIVLRWRAARRIVYFHWIVNGISFKYSLVRSTESIAIRLPRDIGGEHNIPTWNENVWKSEVNCCFGRRHCRAGGWIKRFRYWYKCAPAAAAHIIKFQMKNNRG